ncbi:MAG: aldo/keto reductase [Solobacterium sp.]|nr:aldo/keto reductase [Solobacterium sp.]
MLYQKLGKTDIEVSRIAFGAWGIGGGNVWSDLTVDAAHVGELLDQASDLGINYVDTAPVYGIGASEKILGQALKRRRERFIVQTKCSLNWRNEGGQFEYERDGYIVNRDHRAQAIRKDVEESLLRMDLDHMDVLVVHRISSVVPVQETMEELQCLIKEGKIRAVMLSNSTPADFREYSRYGIVAGVQEKFSLLNDAKREYFETCDTYDAVFQVYGSLEEGILAGTKVLNAVYGKGDIRSGSKWMKEPYRTGLLQMKEKLDPLCEKYSCSYANLVQAWTLAQNDKINLLTGFRHKETMIDTCKVLDLCVDKEDLEYMTKCRDDVRELTI